MIYAFLSGATAMGCGISGLFFYHFWTTTNDRLFAFFTASFAILAVERVVPIVLESEYGSLQFLIRLAAFVLILIAIFDKNLKGRGNQ